MRGMKARRQGLLRRQKRRSGAPAPTGERLDTAHQKGAIAVDHSTVSRCDAGHSSPASCTAQYSPSLPAPGSRSLPLPVQGKNWRRLTFPTSNVNVTFHGHEKELACHFLQIKPRSFSLNKNRERNGNPPTGLARRCRHLGSTAALVAVMKSRPTRAISSRLRTEHSIQTAAPLNGASLQKPERRPSAKARFARRVLKIDGLLPLPAARCNPTPERRSSAARLPTH